MKADDVVRLAMEAGFMLSTAYGQGSAKLMPVSDRKTLEAFAAAVEREALERAAQWRPIGSAPKDGTHIDVWLGNDEFPTRRTDVYWGRPHHVCGEAGRHCDSCPPDRDMWCDDLFYGDAEDLQPTHWMPRPSPPSQDKETARG